MKGSFAVILAIIALFTALPSFGTNARYSIDVNSSQNSPNSWDLYFFKSDTIQWSKECEFGAAAMDLDRRIVIYGYSYDGVCARSFAGRQIWTVDLPDGPPIAALFPCGDVILVFMEAPFAPGVNLSDERLDTESPVTALDVRTGKPLWTSNQWIVGEMRRETKDLLWSNGEVYIAYEDRVGGLVERSVRTNRRLYSHKATLNVTENSVMVTGLCTVEIREDSSGAAIGERFIRIPIRLGTTDHLFHWSVADR